MSAGVNDVVASARGRPFVLPAQPIDRHEIAYWRVGHFHDDPNVRHFRLVYIADATYADVFPGEKGGAPFFNEWLIYEDGCPRGRTRHGFAEAFDGIEYGDSFATFEEARMCALSQLAAARAARVQEIEAIDRRSAAMRTRSQ